MEVELVWLREIYISKALIDNGPTGWVSAAGNWKTD
jgi:hypothetical protein